MTRRRMKKEYSMTALLSSTYFGPVQWYQKLNRYGTAMVERHENFVKQTYRNRCIIAAANGAQALTVPVERPEGTPLSKSLIKDIRISDHGNWRHIHWNALKSAYGESPFFEYYADDLLPFFTRRWTFLYDFNMEICRTMCSLLDIEPDIRYTDSYIPPVKDSTDGSPAIHSNGTDDYRYAICPKHPMHDETFSPVPYYQVYAAKTGFLPNMSILDLLFNMGNESVLYL